MAITEKDIIVLTKIARLRYSELELRRVPYDAEQKIMELIRLGKYNDIIIRPFSALANQVGDMAKDQLTHYTYLVVASIAGWSRAAIDGGALPDDVFDLSDALLYTLSHAETIQEIQDVYQLSAVMLAKLVDASKERQPSYQVVQAQNYISCNIHKKITLEDLARQVGLSPHYLSNLFSAEMGISVHNYIQKEKIKVSCHFLKNSNRTVSDIAAYMGFQTPSHFTAVFRKWMDMTPTEYRQQKYRKVY